MNKKNQCKRCQHERSDHKPGRFHLPSYKHVSHRDVAYLNLAPTHCTVALCTCIAFIEKDGSGEEKILPVSERQEKNPFRR